MKSDEVEFGNETASLRNFYVNPKRWALTAITLGMYFVVTYITCYYTRYRLTNQRLIKESGLLTKRVDEIELFRVRDSRLSQMTRCPGAASRPEVRDDNPAWHRRLPFFV